MADYKVKIGPADRRKILELTHELCGTHIHAAFKGDVYIMNVRRRMDKCGFDKLDDYLTFPYANANEYKYLLSALTIHTTSWFREKSHFNALITQLSMDNYSSLNRLSVCSYGCSTGEEVYSIGLILENHRRINPNFDYIIHGYDIDPISLETAEQPLYSLEFIQQIPTEYHRFTIVNKSISANWFTLIKEIQSRCHFHHGNLLKSAFDSQAFDLIFCRNLIIYLEESDIRLVVKNLIKHLNHQGILFLGHSETIDYKTYQVSSMGHSMYQKTAHPDATSFRKPSSSSIPLPRPKYQPIPKPIQPLDPPPVGQSAPPVPLTNKLKHLGNFDKSFLETILLVDDDPFLLNLLEKFLIKQGFKVKAVTSVGEAVAALQVESFFLLVSDYHLPDQTGLQLYNYVQAHFSHLPFVLITGENQEAIWRKNNKLGVVQVLFKPLNLDELAAIVNIVGKARHLQLKLSSLNSQRLRELDGILIGSSTGGPQALEFVLKTLPANCPPIIIVQHMPAYYLKPFARRLSELTQRDVIPPTSELIIESGKIYIADDDYHLEIAEVRNDLCLRMSNAPPIKSLRPSADHLFFSAAKCKSKRFLCILLTGMGSDGAAGIKALHENNSITIAQSPASCMIFGMPKAAILLDAIQHVASLEEIIKIIGLCEEDSRLPKAL